MAAQGFGELERTRIIKLRMKNAEYTTPHK